MTHSLPSSIRNINMLPEAEKFAVYRQLIPTWVFDCYGIDSETLLKDGRPVVTIRGPANSRAVEIRVVANPGDRDPLTYLNMIDTFSNQLMVLLMVINDPDAPRFDIDVDEDGNPNHFATQGRNIPAEIQALAAGLAPGQIRRGLRAAKASVPLFETFVEQMGHKMFSIEPLSYHNAVSFERYGFAYITGRKQMEFIHQEFLPGGTLHQQLDGSTPFRHPDAHLTIRGRSWAIHDGILGYPFTGFQMYKRLGEHSGVNTFPDAHW
jgi:hypothetical protein